MFNKGDILLECEVNKMMEEHMDDIWSAWKLGFYIIIPTNGFVKKNGEAVMGRGLAWQASQKFPTLPKELGDRIKSCGNMVFVFMKYRIITFPVKHNWMEDADPELIKLSAIYLQDIFKDNLMGLPTPVFVPKVGCGNGKLNWTNVKPILDKILDDKFVLCNSEKFV